MACDQAKKEQMDRPIFRTIYAFCVMLTFAFPVVFIVGAIVAAYPAILAAAVVIGVLILLIKIFRS
jgi:hypothetical protein